MLWPEGDCEGGAMTRTGNVDCIYADVTSSKRRVPSDDRIEFIQLLYDDHGDALYVKRASDK